MKRKLLRPPFTKSKTESQSEQSPKDNPYNENLKFRRIAILSA